MSKKTIAVRVTAETRNLIDEVQKIVAVESKGEILDKLRPVEIALKEFIEKRKGK